MRSIYEASDKDMSEIPPYEKPGGPLPLSDPEAHILSGQSLQVAKCVECILSRGEDSEVIAKEVASCTSVPYKGVIRALSKLDGRGALRHNPISPTMPGHRTKLTRTYSLEEGQTLLAPGRRCERPAQDYILEAIGERGVRLLTCLGHLTSLDLLITDEALTECTEITDDVSFGWFTRMGLLTRTITMASGEEITEHALSERGRWLAHGLVVPASCPRLINNAKPLSLRFPEGARRTMPPGPDQVDRYVEVDPSEVTADGRADAIPGLEAMVRAFYPPERQDRMLAVALEWHNAGILMLDSSLRLRFSLTAEALLRGTGQRALATYSGLGPLIDGKPFTRRELCLVLGISEENASTAALAQLVRARYLEPLKQRLAQPRDDTG